MSDDDWMQLTVQAPAGVIGALMAYLEAEHDFAHIPDGIDWCVLEREQDLAHVSYAPCEPITVNPYVVDWRKGERRGDVRVEIEEAP